MYLCMARISDDNLCILSCNSVSSADSSVLGREGRGERGIKTWHYCSHTPLVKITIATTQADTT